MNARQQFMPALVTSGKELLAYYEMHRRKNSLPLPTKELELLAEALQDGSAQS